ncbi:hypothetical protein EYF80_040804 [Liparis tanakae]|uniref:Uncharacterized protein n=1 Tax=Liparis tanakae TaxID=230148 RepID=A0A4Z2G5X9_9TELE|nr:hypothetical protein EYF80_040804 [Liparis tanakae]
MSNSLKNTGQNLKHWFLTPRSKVNATLSRDAQNIYYIYQRNPSAARFVFMASWKSLGSGSASHTCQVTEGRHLERGAAPGSENIITTKSHTVAGAFTHPEGTVLQEGNRKLLQLKY